MFNREVHLYGYMIFGSLVLLNKRYNNVLFVKLSQLLYLFTPLCPVPSGSKSQRIWHVLSNETINAKLSLVGHLDFRCCKKQMPNKD